MEERQDSQLELLTQIHNQLVDLTKMIAEIEMSTSNSELLKSKLRQVIVTSQHIDATGKISDSAPRQQKVIAPTDTSITPGQANQP
jgi:hypothetical protein